MPTILRGFCVPPLNFVLQIDRLFSKSRPLPSASASVSQEVPAAPTKNNFLIARAAVTIVYLCTKKVATLGKAL